MFFHLFPIHVSVCLSGFCHAACTSLTRPHFVSSWSFVCFLHLFSVFRQTASHVFLVFYYLFYSDSLLLCAHVQFCFPCLVSSVRLCPSIFRRCFPSALIPSCAYMVFISLHPVSRSRSCCIFCLFGSLSSCQLNFSNL